MSKNSKFGNVTASLLVENRNIENIIFNPQKPVLDSELNFISDGLASKTQDLIRSLVPSGWLDADFSIGYDNSYASYGINTTDTPNIFYISSKKSTPLTAIVNGWRIDVGGYGVNDSVVQVVLPAAPSSGSRDDLVFLEVWKRLISCNPSTDGKPSASTIYKYGNTQYSGTNLSDDFVNPTVGFETTQRVQVQYRIRVVPNVAFAANSYGITDSTAVLAQGGAASPIVGYSFINAGNSLNDYGLYIAGNGSDMARSDLNTVDGYVYAIPMCRIHRRNTASFSNSNQNGASISILAALPSDRPDGLFYDKLVAGDFEDLRHSISFDGFNYAALLESNLDAIYSGTLASELTDGKLDPTTVFADTGLFIDSISSSSFIGINKITNADGQRRYFGDAPKSVRVYALRTTDDKSPAGPTWQAGDTIQIAALANAPAIPVIDAAAPLVYAIIGGVITSVVGSWNSGTAVRTFTLGSTPALSNQNIHISYLLNYPQKGHTFTRPLKNILKAKEVSTDQNFGWVSVNDFNNDISKQNYAAHVRHDLPVAERNTNGCLDYAFSYLIGSLNGVSKLMSYFMDGNGTAIYTIPASAYADGLLYVYAAYDVVGPNGYMAPVTVTLNINGSIQVVLPTSFVSGTTIRFDIVVASPILQYNERIMSLEDIATVDFYSTPILAGQSSVIIAANDIVYGTQGMYIGASYSSYCYVNNTITPCTYAMTSNSNLVTVTLASPVGVNSTLTACLYTAHTLASSDALQMYYLYQEYKGITNKNNFGSREISSKVMYHRNLLEIITSGTGALNTADTLPSNYEPIIPKLPLTATASYGDFASTVHKSKTIAGGSYSAELYPAPYSAGKSNFMTKLGVSQTYGTNKGGQFSTSADAGEAGIGKLIVGALVEMIEEDTSNNFVLGELGLKIETNFLTSTSSNKVTNYYDGDHTNGYDMYRLKGRPLLKVKKEI